MRPVDPEAGGELNLAPWARYSDYEIENGVLKPARDASLEHYDPWHEFNRTRESKSGARPYKSLLSLLGRLRELRYLRDRDDPDDPDDRDHRDDPELEEVAHKLLKSWAGKNGLLGLLSHHTTSAFLRVRFGYLHEKQRSAKMRLNQVIKIYARTPAGWEESVEFRGHPLPGKRNEVEGDLVPANLLPAGMLAGTVFGNDQPFRRSFRAQPIEKAWAHHFPGVKQADRATFEYPRPLSDEFWPQYGENIEAVLQAAVRLEQAATDLAILRDPPPDTDEFRKEHGSLEAIAARSRREMNMLVEPIGPAFSFVRPPELIRDGVRGVVPDLRWPCTSLLAAYAMMIALDARDTRRTFRHCDICGAVFLAHIALGQRSCSSACRMRRRDKNRPPRNRRKTKKGARHGK